MNHTHRRLTLRTLILFTLLPLAASTAWAQSAGTKPIYPIEFKRGAKTAVVEGTVTLPSGEGDMHNSGSERYSLTVRAGQTIRMKISSDNGEVIFSLFTPGEEIVEKSGGVKRWSGKLNRSGNYLVTVFTRNRTARFKLRVTLR